MRNTWIVLTGTGMIALALVIGALAWDGAIPGAQAMGMTGPFAQMHGDSHGDMHGCAGHGRIHADCDDETSMRHPHEAMNSHSECPYHSGGHSMMGRMMNGHGHHMDGLRGEHQYCSMVDEDV